ncbi:MAG: Rid family detoxifying hydrolase [Candidatus Dojkabacteria bacterium]|nr:Rid family detoxifying hydrolase [Candidatus Dojkabacteria bacterium]
MKQAVLTDKAPQPIGPFSQAVRMGSMIFTSGQVYQTSDGKLIEGTIAEKTNQIMENLKSVLEAAGVTFDDVVKTTIYVTDLGIYADLNEAYGKYLKEPFPARETVCVKSLPLGADIEISMVAVV